MTCATDPMQLVGWGFHGVPGPSRGGGRRLGARTSQPRLAPRHAANTPVRVDAKEAVAARSLAYGAADLARELRLVHALPAAVGADRGVRLDRDRIGRTGS